MATYNFSVTPKSRGKGKSAAAELSYVSRSKLNDLTTGRNFDNREKEDLVWTEVFLPSGASPEWTDLQKLADALEAYSSDANARICKSFIAALPNELSTEGKIALGRQIGERFRAQGIVCVVGFHSEIKNGIQNDHLHILASTKPCKDEKFVPGSMAAYKCIHKGEEVTLTARQYNALKETSAPAEKIYRYVPVNAEATSENTLRLTTSQYESMYKDTHVRKSKQPEKIKIDLTDWDSKEWLIDERKNWANDCNARLELEGFETRVSEKSYKEQGIERVPGVHLGTVAAKMERENPGSTAKGQKNLAIQQRNAGIEKINWLLDNNVIVDDVGRTAAQEIKKELLEDDSAELMEVHTSHASRFEYIVKKLEEAKTRFCSYVLDDTGFVLFLRNQLSKVERALNALKEKLGRKHYEGTGDVLENATGRVDAAERDVKQNADNGFESILNRAYEQAEERNQNDARGKNEQELGQTEQKE